ALHDVRLQSPGVCVIAGPSGAALATQSASFPQLSTVQGFMSSHSDEAVQAWPVLLKSSLSSPAIWLHAPALRNRSAAAATARAPRLLVPSCPWFGPCASIRKLLLRPASPVRGRR